MSFEFAYARTADFEGGWANDPNDRGSKTMHGVTESTWLDYWRRRGTNQKPSPAMVKEMRNE